MALTRVALLFVALSAGSALASASPSHGKPALTVRLHLEFDRSIVSSVIEKIAKDEASAIWKVYGVDLVWTDQGGRPAVSLDAIVERDHRHAAPDGAPMVLGHTTVAASSPAQPIHVSFDAVNALLGQQYGETRLVQQREIATALGRVLAHEIGHILLGAPAYHDPAGLMRTTLPAADLTQAPRSRFRLTEFSVARLRARIVLLSASTS